MIKIVLVEDEVDVQDLLISILSSVKEFELLGIFSNGQNAVRNIPLLKPDIVLMDLGLPDISGIECIKTLKEKGVESEFMIFSAFDDSENIYTSLEVGATSFLMKGSKPDYIIQSIKDLHDGGSPMNPEIAKKLIQRIYAKPENEFASIITAREKEILELLSKGYLYKEIADQLEVSYNTIKTQCYKLYKKLQVTNRTEAVNKVMGKQ